MPAATKQAGPSGSASKDGKGKRVRKRMRNKKRTAQVEDSSDSSSSSSDDSDDQDEKPKAAAPMQKPAVEQKKKAAKDDTDDDSSSDSDSDSDAGDADGKRKRKRKRAQKKQPTKDASTETATATLAATPSAAAPAHKSTPAKPINLKPEDIGPDPNTDLRLSDQAKQAIQYAQVYSKDKSQWKFNKAKQNWLLRNALSVPPSDYEPILARKQPDSAASAGAGGAAEEAEEAEEGENFVPEDFVLVVTAYLNSVMGGARQRLIESLREAVNAPAVTVARTQTEVTEDASKNTATNEEGSKPPTEGAATKSVSFGNLALETEEEAAEAAGLPAATDPQAVELRRARATQMLQQMGESV
ncbi:hypothetical protein NDA16_001782 [Ustilago loliicola]|nr:hypothetical protein NDA16_001782 [Ustilago loliicola]